MPACFKPAERAEVVARARVARESLRACMLCERRCGVDRLSNARAPCGLGQETWCFKRHISYAEEVELLPSYMVYFAGCNFRCRFCVQGPTCFSPRAGVLFEPEASARDFQGVIDRGARTINLLGGEPSLHLHTILELAAAAEHPLPLVLNTNMYMSPEVIDLLDGVIALYIADFKFGSDRCAQEIAGIDRYTEVVTRNLIAASKRADLIVRHLLMPGHVDCCLRPVAEWLHAHLPGVRFTLMTGYVPAWQAAGSRGDLARTLTETERREAQQILSELSLGSGG